MPDTTKEKILGGVSSTLSAMGKDQDESKQKSDEIASKASQESSVDRSSEKPINLQGSSLGSFKEGGDVKKTGNYKLHEGEKVIPVSGPKRKSMYRQIFKDRMKEKGNPVQK